MRMKIYNFLVNRHSGIRSRYHRIHENRGLIGKAFSYIYLLWLNFCYYILFCRYLDCPEETAIYEEKKLPVKSTESAERLKTGKSVEEAVEYLSGYDIVSFDIFDTLILRPFSEPTDLFYFLAAELDILDMKRIRVEQEAAARRECFRRKGHYEVTFREIWERMERVIGISSIQGMKLEEELEQKFCYANPFMEEVFHSLQEMGKKIIAVSDMYLPEKFLSQLLEQKGYTGISGIYVSCEYGCSKGNGGLFEIVKNTYRDNTRIIHVGDNEYSDVKMARRSGVDSFYYPNVNKMALSFRPYDMSPVIGGAYRGIVDNHLYTGLYSYSMEYEYGFIYGGLFAVGYCNFIHEYCEKHRIDRLLFLSRDGDILKQVYDRMYPADDTRYVYWSRTAAVKLMAEYNRYDYFRRFLYHKVNQNIPIRKILQSMDLELLSDKLEAYVDRDIQEKDTGTRLALSDELTDKNVEPLKRFLQKHYDEITAVYRVQNEAAKQYYTAELAGAGRAAAVDIGWAGSGAMSLAFLAERVWKLPCEVTGIIAGTNTVHNAEPDASEMFLQNGKLVSYLFSQSHNRDLLKKHDINKDYNVFWELLLSSPTPQFLGFGFQHDGKGNGTRELELCFGKLDENQDGIREIQKGILDFADQYREHFEDCPYMFAVSGRDAYAPMLLAAGHKEKYLRAIERRFALEINVC